MEAYYKKALCLMFLVFEAEAALKLRGRRVNMRRNRVAMVCSNVTAMPVECSAIGASANVIVHLTTSTFSRPNYG